MDLQRNLSSNNGYNEDNLEYGNLNNFSDIQMLPSSRIHQKKQGKFVKWTPEEV